MQVSGSGGMPCPQSVRGGSRSGEWLPACPTHRGRTADRPASADITLCFARLEPRLYLEVLNF